MANILCLAVSKIQNDENLEYNKHLGTQDTYKLYEAMSEIVIHSAETYIQEDFDIVVLQDDVKSYQEIFHKNFQNVYDVWNEDGPNNILFLDTDTLVVAPVEVFGKYDRFQMFNYTDPKRLSGKDKENKYGLDHEHYFNAGCRYYPDTMTKEVWDLGWSYAKDWDYNIWGTEQIIFNEMMYSQDRDYKTWLTPEMGYQVMNLPFNKIDGNPQISALEEWNGLEFSRAKIMHLHGTRSAVNTVLLQWEFWRRSTGEEFEFTNFIVKKDSSGNVAGLDYRS